MFYELLSEWKHDNIETYKAQFNNYIIQKGKIFQNLNIRGLLKRCGEFRLHSLRSVKAIFMYFEKQDSVEEIMQTIGWTSKKSFETYTKMVPLDVYTTTNSAISFINETIN